MSHGSCGPRVLGKSNLYANLFCVSMFRASHQPQSAHKATQSLTARRSFYIKATRHLGLLKQDVVYLILRGELPAQSQFQDSAQHIKRHTLIHEQMINLYQGIRRDAYPMVFMVVVVCAPLPFYHDSLDIKYTEQREVESFLFIS